MNNVFFRTILIVLPVLTGVLVYGAVAQQRVLWSVLSMVGVLAVIGFGVLATSGAQPARAPHATVPYILRAYALTTIVVTGAIAVYDVATGNALRWGFYTGFLTPSVAILLALGMLRLTRPRG